MKKSTTIFIVCSCILGIAAIIGCYLSNQKETSKTYQVEHNKSKIKTEKIEGTILTVENGKATMQEKSRAIYTFQINDINAKAGDTLLIEYTGELNRNQKEQKVSVLDYKVLKASTDSKEIPKSWLDNGIFSKYYTLAYEKLQQLSLEEKIGQLFLVRYPSQNALEELSKYQFGGYLFFEKDFKDKTKQEIINRNQQLQKQAKIPLLIAVDEEGGKVVRVSSNPKLSQTKFQSPQELYRLGGLEKIKQDTIEKSKLLKELGINLNLAPVVDVTTNASDYMYERSLGQDSTMTAEYAKTVIGASKNTDVSYTLKHFPGYGNNKDTHTSSSVDTRTYEEIQKNDLPPFQAGIDAGAEAVLISHNTVTSIDPNLPASLSPDIHNLLHNQLHFTGISITDDLYMTAASSIDNAALKALLAGNELIITTDYQKDIESIKQAVRNGTIDQTFIDQLAFRILAWKYAKGMMFQTAK